MELDKPWLNEPPPPYFSVPLGSCFPWPAHGALNGSTASPVACCLGTCTGEPPPLHCVDDSILGSTCPPLTPKDAHIIPMSRLPAPSPALFAPQSSKRTIPPPSSTIRLARGPIGAERRRACCGFFRAAECGRPARAALPRGVQQHAPRSDAESSAAHPLL